MMILLKALISMLL